MEEKCPFCGAEQVENIVQGVQSFACGTDIILNEPPDKWRVNDCFNRQIVNLAERLKAWRGLKTWIQVKYGRFEPLTKLRELGEIE